MRQRVQGFDVHRLTVGSGSMAARVCLALVSLLVALVLGGTARAQSPDGVEDTSFYPSAFWAVSYYEGREGIPGSTVWGSPTNGGGSTGTAVFRGEAYWGIGTNSVRIASNGSAASNRWSQFETPTSPNLHHPSYVGATWAASGNPYYQIDMRRTVLSSGNLTFGGLPDDILDDSIEVFVNGVRVYAYFPSGGAPNPRPSATQSATIPVSAGDQIRIRFMNLGFIGGFAFTYSTPNSLVVANNDNASGVNGQAGSASVLNVLSNDTVGGAAATSSNATLALIGSLPSGLTFNTSTGIVGVQAGTAAGTYSFTYRLCALLETTNCANATASVTVGPSFDLAVSKSNGSTAVYSGSTTTYSIIVTHAGGETVTGAVVTDLPGTGLSCSAASPVTISGNGVPSGSFSIADLTGPGIPLGTLASGQSTTLSYSCQVN